MGNCRTSRRDFLKAAAALAASAGVVEADVPLLAQGLQQLARRSPRVLWLQGLACAGCSVSLLNADSPPILQVITGPLALAFHPTLSAAQGRLAMDVIDRVGRGPEPFVLVVEGAVPVQMPDACRLGGRTFAELLLPLLGRARFIVAAGTCASFGGIPAAEGNVTGAAGVWDFMRTAKLEVRQRLVLCRGCPVHPDELLLTLAHLAAKGYPEVQSSLVPVMFTKNCLHDVCPRMPQYLTRIFATQFGDPEACLYALGCRGLDVSADCHFRQWNGKVNWCIEASAPCIGCTLPDFGKARKPPLFRSG